MEIVDACGKLIIDPPTVGVKTMLNYFSMNINMYGISHDVN